MGLYDDLMPEERLSRVARIINKGIHLYALNQGWIDKKEKKKPELNPEEQQIIELCRKNGRISNKDVQQLLKVHRNTAMQKLRRMELKNLLKRKGNGKSSYYFRAE